VWEHWVALHSAVLDSSMSTPRRAPPADPFTAPLSLSPCPLRLHDPCRGREGALHACSHLRLLAGGVWRVDTRAPSPERVFGGRRMRPLAHTPCTTTLQSSSHPLSSYKPLSHHPTAASARSSSARWVPPCPALHTRADSTQHQTREGQTMCTWWRWCEAAVGHPHLAVTLSHTPLPGVLHTTCRTRQGWCRAHAWYVEPLALLIQPWEG
jgi:hypothetical protein